MKVKHIQECPICRKSLGQDKINPLYPKGGRLQVPGQVFMCFSPLADNPLHYYSHTVLEGDPDWIVVQEFTVDIGSRYIMFHNDYQQDKSYIKANYLKDPLDVPVLLIPDFPNLESLRSKIKLSITFS